MADTGCNAVRKVAPDGSVSTLAGKLGTPGDVQGLVEAARFQEPFGLTYNSQIQRLYVTDRLARRILRVNPFNGGVADEPELTNGLTSIDGAAEAIAANRNIPGGISYASTGVACIQIVAGSAIAPEEGEKVDFQLNDGEASRIGGFRTSIGPAMLSLPSVGTAFCVRTNGTAVGFSQMQPDRLNPGRTKPLRSATAGQVFQSGRADGQGNNALFINVTGLAAAGSQAVFVADADAVRLIEFAPSAGDLFALDTTTLIANLSAPFAPTRQLTAAIDGRTLFYTTPFGVVKVELSRAP